MPNSIGANPWSLNTIPFSYPYPVKITNIVWANYATGAQTLLIQDINGNDIINVSILATDTATSWTFGGMLWVRGVVLVTLSSGEVTIAIGAGK